MYDDYFEYAILCVLSVFTVFSAAGLWHVCVQL